jgi:methionyl-tRNA formyltransferase
MKIAFVGCVDFSHTALAHLMTLPDIEVVGVVTRHASSMNADFCSLADLAVAGGVPVCFAEGNDQDGMAAFLSRLDADVIYCFGWSYLLGRKVLASASKGVIGYHPAALPANRGRHPLIWALALGLKETASTFFFMDEGADSGDLLDQAPLVIEANDNAATLYAKMSRVACAQITTFTAALAAGEESRIRQNDANANTWRKRGPADGEIDWRMSAAPIHNLVRALSRPYVGAHCIYQGREVKIWRVEPNSIAPANFEPGKVLAVDGDCVEIKCADGSIRILEHEFSPLPQQGGYL